MQRQPRLLYWTLCQQKMQLSTVKAYIRRMPVNPADGAGAELGKLVAAALASAWRQPSTPLSLSPDALARITIRLLETGAGGLAWWRMRGSNRRKSRVVTQLRQAYRLQTLQASLCEEHIQQVFTCCRAAGVEPLLGKGWAIARLYPEPGLRPYGDIDLFIRPEQHSTVLAALDKLPDDRCPVDLHRGFPDLADDAWDKLHLRSRLVKLGEVEVRILGSEDHLRHLCLHLLRHGAWCPLWLCDIGVALESRPANFDWDYCLRGSRRRSQAVACTLGLARQLLGACVDEPRIVRKAKRLPGWLVPAVLRQWGSPYKRFTGRPMAAYLSRPAGLLQALGQRWPNPIEATMSSGAPFNEIPRLPFQLSDCLIRLIRFLGKTP